MRIRSQVMRMRSSANNVMRMGILLEFVKGLVNVQ